MIGCTWYAVKHAEMYFSAVLKAFMAAWFSLEVWTNCRFVGTALIDAFSAVETELSALHVNQVNRVVYCSSELHETYAWSMPKSAAFRSAL